MRPRAGSSAGFRAGPELSHAACHTRGVCSFRLLLAATAAFLAIAGRADNAPPRVIPQELVERQPVMIDAQVRAISEHAPPGPQAYFLGFAGVGEERVFAQEIELAAARLAGRFGLADRSLRLVNDQRDLEAYPLASVAALHYALKALGRIMDDDDVLFLALSSHGWKDATLAISNPGMRPDALSAKDLARMLDEAGIRWRVIVISACYAGSFIKPLADEHTILITAAAKNRPSFGCGADSELTYFGEAFYRDALPAAPTLRAAFDSAKFEITMREKAERERPSNPQAYFGRLMEAKLEELAGAR